MKTQAKSCVRGVWVRGDCYCVIIYNTPSIIVCVTHSHRCRTVKGWEWASVGASYINQQACGVCGVRTLDCYFLWARISLLLVKTGGVESGGVKTQPSFLPWSKEQRVQRRNYTCEALSMEMRPLLFYVHWLQQLTPNDETSVLGASFQPKLFHGEKVICYQLEFGK